MADFTSLFWSGFIGGITIASIVALTLFVRHQSRVRTRKGDNTSDTTGHRWDGDLEESNNPMPAWWLNLFYITLFWGAGYLIAYPGLGAFEGVLGWSQESQYEAEVAAAAATFDPLYDAFAKRSLSELGGDPQALQAGHNLYASYCTQCHGSDAAGARGFPNLTDNDWQWGGTPELIEQSILNGRNAAMPAWGAVLKPAGVDEVTAYVEQLAGRSGIDQARAAAGKAHYTTFCVVCHGENGDGNQALGAPRLNDDIWLYGGSTKRIAESIANGRNGIMPAHQHFLGEAKAHLLAAYIYSLTQNVPAERTP